ncbi:MAG: hypothetical protein LBS36_07685 [Oscillospiraceae bacterium]|nr:hypothetical protein [Oscillospiraceae bacterium]
MTEQEFNRENSDNLFQMALDDIDNLNSRDGRFEYSDYVTLHNDVTGLYDSFSFVDEIIKTLREQLAESQRRERAAVDDLIGAGPCFSCKHFRRNDGDCFGAGKCRVEGIEIIPCDRPGTYRIEIPDDGRNTYEWRGPQPQQKNEVRPKM